MDWPNHGGQPAAIKRMFNIALEKEITDFSANLNPLGPPQWLREEWIHAAANIAAYPDPAYSAAKEAIAHHEGIQAAQALVTNGGAEAIYLVAKHFEGKRALIVQPTFLEYERACRHYHVEVEDVYLHPQHQFALPLDEIVLKMKSVNVIFLCRPNNPTGTAAEEDQLKILLDAALSANITVVVDEAFADFLPASIPSLTGWLERYPNLILLRSLTKMYTIPGLRIGYVIAHEKIIAALQGYQIPWSVNAVAAALIPNLLSDKEIVKRTGEWLKKELQHVKAALDGLGFYQSPAKANFYLLQDPAHPLDTQSLFLFLLEQGILARHTHTFKGLEGQYLRFAVRSEEENKRLIECLRRWRERL